MIKMINNKILISGLVVIFWLVTNISFAKVNDLPPATSNKIITQMMVNDKIIAAWWHINNINTWATSTWSIQTYSYHKNNTWKNNTWIALQTTLWWGGKNTIIKKAIKKSNITTTKSKVVKVLKKKK